ncbi:MAG: ABC transporter permease [Bryobacteraceae bacterium]|nr:ABC transporter permease [Bryobacteraceae bacterium]
MIASRLPVVLRKELLDGVRDRRSVASVVISALIGPLLVGFLFSQLAERQRVADEVKVPVVGAEFAPALVDWLKQQSGVSVVAGPARPEEAVRERKEDVVVIIARDFSSKFARSAPAGIKLVADATRDTARTKVRRVRQLLQRYSGEVSALRLIGRGISPAVAVPLRIEDVEVSSAQQRAAMIMAFVPMFLIMAAFVGGLQIATDSTAGERERASLEPLLLNPVSRWSVVAGKWLAASLFAGAGVVFSASLCMVVMQRVPLHDLGARFRLGAPELAAILALCVPVGFFSSSLQIFIATFAKSYKEAQSYLGLLMLLPTLPGVLAPIYPISGQPWLAPIPILGHYSLVTDLLGGKALPAHLLVISAVSTLCAAIVLVALTTRLFHKERIIFGR